MPIPKELGPLADLTVRALLNVLEGLDPDAIVLVEGYEGGYEPAKAVSVARVMRVDDAPGFYGEYATQSELPDLTDAPWVEEQTQIAVILESQRSG